MMTLMNCDNMLKIKRQTIRYFPVGKIAEKAVCVECIFDNMALYF